MPNLSSLKVSGWAGAAGLHLLLAGVVATPAMAADPVSDPLGVIKIQKGAPIQIGGYWVLSGPDAALGIDSKRGVELAFKDRGGKIDGHQLQLNAQDSLCTPEGGQTAATKLAANPATVIVLGSACSSEVTAAAPILWKAGITNIGTSASAPKLTAPDRKPGYDGFVRTIPNDLDQGKADAEYVFNTLKKKSIVTIHDGSPFAEQLQAVMAGRFKELGGTVLSQEATTPTEVDMKPLLTNVAALKPDLVYMPIFVAAASQIIRQAKDVPGLEKTSLLGSNGLMSADLIQAAGSSVVGFQFTYQDISPEALGKAYPKFVEAYKAAYGEAPISGYHANAYDAATAALNAIEKVAVTNDNGDMLIGKKALRDAVFATQFDGLSGRISCDKLGNCAQFHHAVYEYTNADVSTYEPGKNPKKIYP
ncbi:ABC transporter substrate-binding protein [Starkeya sp. ORNL1]|uniref:branched-chain amino acid ABC transporter substrate-binding protein n=1 Tax=Starkeya sp. ORNL1 TaxID=2709380 RepID=UPI001462EC12|nr:branched-chain amino acid ABC transporter substrate-binding protein [Starkeya sp. ORNL1]QJP15799.1 ABC transporter substrate-binding protein [Starkeya sp. ORNL1]